MPVKYISNAPIKDIPFVFFILAVCLYAFLGSPTPDNPGLIEAIIGVLLFLAIGGILFLKQIVQYTGHKQIHSVLHVTILLLYGFSIPVILSLVNGYDIYAIMRDLIGFIFLTLPFFFLPFWNKRLEYANQLIALYCILGVAFALRVLFMHQIPWQNDNTELLYLANSPVLLFSMSWLLLSALDSLCEKITIKLLIQSVVKIAGAGIMILAILQDAQRAPIAALLLGLATMLGYIFYRSPVKALFICLALCTACLPFSDSLVEIWNILSKKTLEVGSNMRFQELGAIWNVMTQSPIQLLFGMGWGASYASPAVGGLYVTYTHSLLSYMFFKTGLIGLFLTLIYLLHVFKKILYLTFRDITLSLSLFWAFVIPVFLYASHKSFDFGLLLVLIFVSYRLRQKQNNSL